MWLTPDRFEQCLGAAIANQSVERLPQFITPDASLYGIGLALKRELETPGGEDQLYAEVAYELGFSHQSHFTRHFKRQVGVTPRQFLAQS